MRLYIFEFKSIIEKMLSEVSLIIIVIFGLKNVNFSNYLILFEFKITKIRLFFNND
jgi:hypothetical protein